MYGAILGDIIGSPYEFDRGDKTCDFPLFSPDSEFTDDSVMSLAVAEAFMDAFEGSPLPHSITDVPEEIINAKLIDRLKYYGKLYPDAGYGARFSLWLECHESAPYNSLGNGSAMRVSAVAWLFDDLASVLEAARISAEPTHNHPEGIKGAQATAAAIFLARSGSSKDEIRSYISDKFGYDLSRSCEEIRPAYHHVESCMETVPEAITAFLEGESFEDVIRTAVSLGGDCDTVAAIAGSIAEGLYGVPETLKAECRSRISNELLAILRRFDERTGQKYPCR